MADLKDLHVSFFAHSHMDGKISTMAAASAFWDTSLVCFTSCGTYVTIWLGHLARMPDERQPKRVLFGHLDGTGVRGKSRKVWTHYILIREDL